MSSKLRGRELPGWTQARLIALIERLRDNPVENTEAHEAAFVIGMLSGCLPAVPRTESRVQSARRRVQRMSDKQFKFRYGTMTREEATALAEKAERRLPRPTPTQEQRK